jgi:hypothetical protein
MLLKMLLMSPRPVDDAVGSGVLVDEETMPVGASRMLLVVDVGGSTVGVALVEVSSVFVVG